MSLLTRAIWGVYAIKLPLSGVGGGATGDQRKRSDAYLKAPDPALDLLIQKINRLVNPVRRLAPASGLTSLIIINTYTASAYSSIEGQVQIKLRSPAALLTRATNAQNLFSLTYGNG